MVKKKIKIKVHSIVRSMYHFVYNVFVDLKCYFTKGLRVHAYEGFLLKIYIADPISKLWYDHDWKRNEIKFLQKGKLKKGVRVFNIGAHHGIVALILSKIVSEKGSVVAVEMDKNHIKMAKINKANNNASNIKIVHAAVSDKKDQILFDKDQVLFKPKKDKAKLVRTISIDGLTDKFSTPAVIYVDVEGYECHVLKSARKTLRSYPDWCIEVHVKNGLEQFGGSLKEIVSYFPQSKYQLYMAKAIDKCKLIPLNTESSIVKDRFYLIALNKN